MVRAVIDANVLASGFPARDGVLRELMVRWRGNEFQVVLSDHIIDELETAWSKPYWRARLTPTQINLYTTAIRESIENVTITTSVSNVATHAADDLVLATAVDGNATYIVTGDKELLQLRHFRGIAIVHPQEFLTRLDEAEGL